MSEKFATHYATNASAEEPSDDDLMQERSQHSIVPKESVAGTALTLVIAIMAFLASLTLGAMSMVSETASGWQSEIAREITIQVKPVDGVDFETAVATAQQIATSFSGINNVAIVDQAAMTRLLEPWLGSGLNLAELPVPQLITLTIDENDPPDFEVLRTKIAETVPGASLDNHRAWLDRLTAMAQATVLIGVVIFMLMMAATILTVVFATRGAMSGNQHVIEVLHFVGADQGYIAGEFQKHFLLLGLKGALSGGALALITFLLVGFWANRNIADPTSDQMTALFGTFSVGLGGYVGTLLLIFTIAILTAMTSRYTVIRYVGGLDSAAQDR